LKTSAYSPREPHFRQIALSSFVEQQEELDPNLISNGKLSQKDEILFILSLVEGRILTKNELYEIVQFVECILGSESIYGIPNHDAFSNHLHSLIHSNLIIHSQNNAFRISKSGINYFKNSFQKTILKSPSLRLARRFLICILPALLDKNPDITQLRIVLKQAAELFSELSGQED
jgi:hypothetical protein